MVCAYKGSFIKDLKSFDPYEILEITDAATDKEIKKAYKILAKKYHPDFNPGDPEANSKFIIVNKAYRCLTDPEVMEKCKQFGNPDGASSYQVAIALPSALLSKKNRPLVLAMFFLVVIVFLPIGVWIWYSENEKLDDFGVNKQSMLQAAGFMRNENIRTQDVMEMISASMEFLPIRACKLGQSNALKKIQDNELMPLISKDKNPYLKVMYLIHAYMGRLKIPVELEDDVKLIHRKVPYLLSVAECLTVVAERVQPGVDHQTAQVLRGDEAADVQLIHEHPELLSVLLPRSQADHESAVPAAACGRELGHQSQQETER